MRFFGYFVLQLIVGISVMGIANSLFDTFASGWFAGILACALWNAIDRATGIWA
jgi:hypothetical protein